MQGAHQLVRTWRRPSSSEVKWWLRRNLAAKKACSDDVFGEEPHERAELFPSAAVGSACARTSEEVELVLWAEIADAHERTFGTATLADIASLAVHQPAE